MDLDASPLEGKDPACEMSQLLLFPDPRPLVERLGPEFFRAAPECAGVYLMRDAADDVLYVGKAKNLRKRLSSYRVANPDRLKSRHLRLLRAVARIEVRKCADETGALSTEAELLRTLRPRFNRAGTWPGPQRFFGWRIHEACLELTVTTSIDEGWGLQGPMGIGAFLLRGCLARLLWCAIHPDRGLAGMPFGWLHIDRQEIIRIPPGSSRALSDLTGGVLNALFAGDAEKFFAWIAAQTVNAVHPFELAAMAEDLETVKEFVARRELRKSNG